MKDILEDPLLLHVQWWPVGSSPTASPTLCAAEGAGRVTLWLAGGGAPQDATTELHPGAQRAEAASI